MKTTFRLNSWAKLGLAIAGTTITSQAALAATTATIDLNTQKFIGGVSDLDRSKYFNIHMTATENQVTAAELDVIKNEFNAEFGRQFWSPFSQQSGAPYPTEADAITAGANSITSAKNHPNASYATKRKIVTDHPGKVYIHGEDPLLAAEWAANYFKHYYDDTNRPMFYEPMNEPFVHAKDFGTDEVAIRLGMTNLFKEIGKKFDQENIQTDVIGYSSAWPSMELWDFGHFNGRMKQFMDVAGPHMDGFSIHPYDGVNVTGASNERSGSNLESLLDLLETYSMYKWSTVKPHAITEYGGIEQGYGDTYTDLRSAQSVASQNKMLMQLLDRQDRLLTSMPFNTGKAAWHYNAANNWNPYGATILRPDPNSIVDGKPTNFFWTKRADFYRLWSDVKGKRVKVDTTNPDIQVNAFVDGNKAYVALNTLADYWETVDLDFVNSLGTITNVRQKLLVVRKSTDPTYTDTTVTAPTSYAMEPGTTVVWEYTFAAPVSFDGTFDTKHHYAPEHLVAIVAGQTNNFTFNGVTAQTGKSVIRMSLGRAHGSSFQPTVTVNGTAVNVNLNWKGGDQASRGEFFGVIEVPVDNSLLQANNTVSVTFPDAGGRIASMVLQVNNDSSVSNVTETIAFGNVITELAPGNSYQVAIDYTAGESRDVTVEFWQNNAWLGQKTTTVQAGTSTVTATVPSSKTTLAGETGYLFKVSIRPVGGNWQTALEYKNMTGISIVDVVTPPTTSTALRSLASNKCIDVPYGSADDGVQLQQYSCWNTSNQKFLFSDAGEGYWNIKNETSGKCLDKTNATTEGAIVHQWSCSTANDNQAFKLIDQGAGYFQIKNQHSGMCLDLVGGIAGTANGTQITQSVCGTSDSQKFSF